MAMKTTTKNPTDDQPRRHVDRDQENDQGRQSGRPAPARSPSPSPSRPAVPKWAAANRPAASGAADKLPDGTGAASGSTMLQTGRVSSRSSDARPDDRPTDRPDRERPEGQQAYYGKLLTTCLGRHTGPVARDVGEGWIAVYKADGDGWRRYGMQTSNRLVPPDLLPHFRPENRGEEFPPGIPFEPLD